MSLKLRHCNRLNNLNKYFTKNSNSKVMEPSRVRGLNYLLFTLGLLGLVAIVLQSVIIGSIIPSVDHFNSTGSDDYTVVQFERTGSSITAGIIYVLTALVGFMAYIRKSYAMYV